MRPRKTGVVSFVQPRWVCATASATSDTLRWRPSRASSAIGGRPGEASSQSWGRRSAAGRRRPPALGGNEVGARDAPTPGHRAGRPGIGDGLARDRSDGWRCPMRGLPSVDAYRMLSIAVIRKATLFLLRDERGLAEYLGPPPPPRPGSLGFRGVGWWAAEPDHPPSTCSVRVVRLGSWYSIAFGCVVGRGGGPSCRVTGAFVILTGGEAEVDGE